MRKTADITKYEIKWQLIRSRIKGKHTFLQDKLIAVNEYLSVTNSYDRWERAYNWLEGLLRGYKAAQDTVSIRMVSEELSLYEKFKILKFQREPIDLDEQVQILQHTSNEDLICLWKDLFKTNSKWLLSGYYHKECNEFMDWIYHYKESDLKFQSRLGNYTFCKLQTLRDQSKNITNSHKFFF